MQKKERTTYTVGPISAARMREMVREALREELDIHGSYAHLRYTRDGVDSHFYAIKRYATGYQSVDPSSVWTVSLPILGTDGALTCPADVPVLQVSHLATYEHPAISAHMRLPPLPVSGQAVYMGLEGGAGAGVQAFMLWNDAGSIKLMAGMGDRDITWALPADYQTFQHHYKVRALKPWFEYEIDHKPVAFYLNESALNPFWIDGPPYSIGTNSALIPWRFPTKLYAFLEIASQGQPVTFPVSPMMVSVHGSEALPPRAFRLYDAGTNTLFTDLTLAAGTETSHPIPVFGYPSKTFHFMADQDGDIDIEVYTQTGNWRVYRSDRFTANSLYSLIMTGDALMARITVDPDAYPCDVAEAEVVMH